MRRVRAPRDNVRRRSRSRGTEQETQHDISSDEEPFVQQADTPIREDLIAALECYLTQISFYHGRNVVRRVGSPVTTVNIFASLEDDTVVDQTEPLDQTGRGQLQRRRLVLIGGGTVPSQRSIRNNESVSEVFDDGRNERQREPDTDGR